MRKYVLCALIRYRWPVYWFFVFIGTLAGVVCLRVLFHTPLHWTQHLISAAADASLCTGLLLAVRRGHLPDRRLR